MQHSVSLIRQFVSSWTLHQPLIAALLVQNAFVLGCSDSDNNGTQSNLDLGDYSVKIAGCEQYDYAGCDITTAKCQQNTFDLVKCVRQTPNGTMPPMQTMTAAQYKAKLLNDNTGANPDDIARLETTLVLLGLASTGDLSVQNQANVLASNILAFYSPDDKNVNIIVPDSGMTANTQRADTLVLAHEFVHALQDQACDLNAFDDAHKATYDASLAAHSVMEGEARFYETRLRVAFDGLAQDAVNLPEYFLSAADYAFSLHTTDSPYLITPLIFPYDYGGRYIYWQLDAGGRSNVDRLYATPPPAALPYILSQTNIDNTALSPVTDPAPTPVSGYTLFTDDSLGAWLTYESIRPANSTSANQDAIDYGGNWRGDHLWIYSDGTANNVTFIWKVRWSTADAASNFAALIDSRFRTLIGLGSTSLQAIASNSDAIVIGVSGTPDLALWVNIAKAMNNQNGAASAGNTSGSTGTPDTRASMRRGLISPIVPIH